MMIGTVIAPLGFILASFATELWHVYLSQGILFGLGASFVFCPSITLPSQWFTKRRALATGLAVSGSGIGGVCFSPMIQAIVDSIGYRNCLRVQGGVGFGILSLATSLAVSRYRPPPLEGDSARWYHFYDKTLISRNFVLLLCFSFFVPFAYIVPFFLAPQFVEHIGLEPSTGAVMISVMCATNALCRICLGYLADKIGRFNTLSSFTFSAALFIMLIWQFCTTYTVYVVFCVLYGLTAGGFVSLLPVTTADIVGVENIQRGLGMAYMITVIGNLVGTPIIGLLLKQFNWTVAIQFAGGVTLIASVFIIILRNIMADGKIFVKV
ncbi:major facilitator superfamily domain-containing protein [Pilobolus umbonatus]|nr:major facilitator superfamily domain-containing protein [Pilobolus umbonatus]